VTSDEYRQKREARDLRQAELRRMAGFHPEIGPQKLRPTNPRSPQARKRRKRASRP
jgi:hypothetical protein